MAYDKTTWTNDTTALSQNNLNHMETGIKDAHDDLATLASNVYTKSEVYTKAESVPSANIKVLNFEVTPASGGAATIEYYTDISSVIDDIDDWAILTMGTHIEGFEAWHYGTRTTYKKSSYVESVTAYNYAFLTAESSTRRIRYVVGNPNANSGTKKVKVRIVLYKVA